MARFRTCFVRSASIVLTLVVSGHAHAAAPALKAHEEVVKTRDDCGFVIDKTAAAAKYQREALAKLTWGGACVEGLAMGEGIVSPGFSAPGQPAMLPVTATVWYGRMFGPGEVRWDNGGVQKNFTWEGKGVSYRSLDLTAPVWSKEHSESSLVLDGETMVMTMLIDKPVVRVNNLQTHQSQQYPCPKGRVKGCEALWAQHAGPVVERIKAFIAANEPKASARTTETQALVAAWKAKVGSATVAKRETDAKRAAGEDRDKQARQAAWEMGCWDKLGQAPNAYDPPASENHVKRARYLQNLLKGECADHHYAQEGLNEADKLLAKVPELRKQEGATARYEKEQEQQREKDRKETAEAIGQLANAVIEYRQAKKGTAPVAPQPGGSASAPAAPGPSTSAGMSAQECDEKIKQVQMESQSWPGNVYEQGAQLGRIQKRMFEGECAGHPQAAVYVASAERMIGQGLQHRYTHNPANDATQCVEVRPGLVGKLSNSNLKIVNRCGYDVEVLWCVTPCNRGYDSLATIKAGGEGPIAEADPGDGAYYAACRFGFNYAPELRGKREYMCK